MSSEAALWQTVRRHLSPYGKLVRIETPLTGLGVPDVVYCLRGVTGWIELKELAAWPKRPTTPLNIPHLRTEQVVFLEGWARAGGLASVLLQVGREYLLFDHAVARRVYERAATRVDVTLAALAHGEGRFPTAAVVRGLTGHPPVDGSERKSSSW